MFLFANACQEADPDSFAMELHNCIWTTPQTGPTIPPKAKMESVANVRLRHPTTGRVSTDLPAKLTSRIIVRLGPLFMVQLRHDDDCAFRCLLVLVLVAKSI